MAEHRVFIADKLSRDALDVLESCSGLEVDYRPDLPDSEKIAAANQAQALIVRSATKVSAAFLQQIDSLELIVRAGVGVDNIDVDAATRKGIVVQNVPDGNVRSAAEHAVALLLSLARNVPKANISMKGGKWERSDFLGTEVQGKTLGVVGLGKIGRHVVDMASGLGMHVLVRDPYVAPNIAEQLGIELVPELSDLVPRVDFLTIHVPLSPETKGLINARALEGAKPDLRIVNCSRGGIVDEDALLRALEEGRLGGVALDVFAEEPPGATALVMHPEVVVTPHLGASTREAQKNVAVGASQQVIDYLLHRRLHSPVNAIQLDPELTDDVQPYRDLALKMGRLHAQILEGNPERIVVKYFGEFFSDRVQSYLTNGVLEGFIGSHSAQPVNFINVRTLSKDQGLAVEERSEGKSRYFVNMIRVEVIDSGGQRALGGTIRGRGGLRLVSLDNYQFDAVFEGSLILVANEDRPGMIGALGDALGSHNVNVSYMSLGRDTNGGTAISVVNVDDGLSAGVIEEIASQPGILWAKFATVD